MNSGIYQFNQNLRDHPSKTMAISLLRKPFNLLLLFVLIVPYQAATQCNYGKYLDSSYGGCRNCSPCDKDVILGTSQDYAPLAECKKYESLCPNWCSVETSIFNPNGGRDACPPTTPSPPVPQVNITIEEPQYNATANAYTVLCTVSFRDMSIPMLKWYDPSGQLLAPTDTSGKWKVTEGGVTQEVVTQGIVSTTLLMKDFEEGNEGNYMCAAQGEQSDNRTILLEYVEPPATTSTLSPTTATTQPSQSSIMPKPTPGESDTPKEGGLSTPWITAIAVFGVVGVVLGITLAICAYKYLIPKLRRRRRCTQRSIVTVSDVEAHPLTGSSYKFLDRLILETSDFKSATVKGIQACLDQPIKCDAVIIKKNGKKIGKVHSNQDAFFIETLAWNDSIEVWMEYPHKNIWMNFFQGDNELIKTLKMNCLKIGNVAETSALISCPSIENTFYMRFEEKNAPGCSSSARSVKPMHGGSKEMCNLRPSVTYCVQLGIKGQTGDSGDYKWPWTEEFPTRSIMIQSVTSAKVTLSEHSIPQSVQLCYEINQSKPQPMTSTEIPISSLIPGMEQVLQIKIEENFGGTSSSRLLQEMTFTTLGSVEDGGDYRGYATTDCPDSDPEEGPGPSNRRRKKPSRTNVPTKCHTGLLEAIHTLQDKFNSSYHPTEQCVLEAVLDSLLEFLKDYNKGFVPEDKYVLNANRKQRGMENIEGFIKLYAMQDYTGVFDLLKRYIHNDKVHTQAGVSFAEQLLKAHCSDLRTCQVCKHAVFLLRRYEKRHSPQSSVC